MHDHSARTGEGEARSIMIERRTSGPWWRHSSSEASTRTLAHARRVVFAGLLVSDAMLGCVAPSTQSRSSEPPSKASVITSAEIESVLWRTETAADVIRTLRPGMLDGRYPTARNSATSGRGQIT